jgi:hypothetical protein
MQFIQKEDGSCDLVFSVKERFLILKKGKIHFTNEAFRHFGNHLGHMVMQWNLKFDEKLSKLSTSPETEIKTK